MSIITELLDDCSFVECNSLMKSAAVTCGYGTVGSSLVYVYEQTGSMNAAHAKKIAAVYAEALTMGLPVVGILNSDGMELSQGLTCLENYGVVLQAQAKAKGIIPQIALVNGSCMGVATFITGLSDFTFEVDKAKLFLQSPNVLEKGVKSTASVSNLVLPDVTSAVRKIRKLLEIIPFNNLDYSIEVCRDDLNREDLGLEKLELREIINTIADLNQVIEVGENYTKVITALGRMGGEPVGLIGAEGCLDSNGIEKMQYFVEYCDSFGIPIITIGDVVGYVQSPTEDREIIVKSGKLIKAFVRATVGKINIIMKQSVGSTYLLLNSKHIGADVVMLWESAKILLLSEEAASKVVKLEKNDFTELAGEEGYIDAIINPAATRKRIIAHLQKLDGKRVRG